MINRLLHTGALHMVMLVSVLFAYTAPCSANSYTQASFYTPSAITLDNGLKVFLSERPLARNVSIRLGVRVGTIDFSCGERALPHMLEHLMFSGTSKHGEAELDRLMDEMGGTWNAYTESEFTVYDIDIFSRNSRFGVEILHEIITDSQLSQESIELVRDVLSREIGGNYTSLQHLLYKSGYDWSSYKEALVELFPKEYYYCKGIQSADGLTRKSLMDTYRKFYVPDNMFLVVVGDFRKSEMLALIKNTFGRMKPGEASSLPRRGRPEPYTSGAKTISNIDYDFYGGDAEVGYLFRTEGLLSEDFHALQVISKYLGTKIYEDVRVKNGWAYETSAYEYAYSNFGYFYVGSDCSPTKSKRILDIIRKHIDALRQNNVDPDDVNRAKQAILLSYARGYESNAEISDYYIYSWPELDKFGRLQDYEALIGKVTQEDVVRVANRYFAPEQTVTMIDKTLFNNPSHLILLFAFFYIMIRIYRRRKKRAVKTMKQP